MFPTCFIHPSAMIGAGCELGHGVVVEAGAMIGNGCVIGHHAVIHAGVQLGSGCRVEDLAVLGRQPRPAPTSTVHVPPNLPPLTIGAHTTIGTSAVVYTGSTVGERCLIGDAAFVREQVQICDRVIVGAHVTIENEVRIGHGVKMQTGGYITAWTVIEDDCFIAPCVVTTNDNYMGRTERRFAERGGAVIRHGARVGANVTLLPNIEVGAEAFIAAGSVVSRPVEPATLVMGSPAKPRRAVPADEFAGA